MVVGSRRRALTAAATALAAVALAVAVAGRGCNTDDDTPVGAARAFDEAARAGDRQAVFDRLGPETRAALTARAARASELGEHRYTALDMVSLGTPDQQRATFELDSQNGANAVVNVVQNGKRRGQLTLVQVDNTWRVELVND